MADGARLATLRHGVEAWNPWRRRHPRRGSARVAVVLRGLLAGLLAAATFQQGALLILSLVGLAPPPSLGLKPDPTQVMPDIASAALWGAVWGAVLAPLLPRGRPRGRGYWAAAALIGAVLPTAAAWAIAAALAGSSPDGSDWLALVVAAVVNGAWGLGTALLLLIICRRGGAPAGHLTGAQGPSWRAGWRFRPRVRARPPIRRPELP